MQNEQGKCPAESCSDTMPTDPGAHGWDQHDGLWWCPSHTYGEYLRLKRYRNELDWYDGNIFIREEAVRDYEANPPTAESIARSMRLPRESPQVKRRLNITEIRIAKTRHELETLQRNRDAAVEHHELECGLIRSNSYVAEDNSE